MPAEQADYPVGRMDVRGGTMTIIAVAAAVYVLHEGAALFVPVFLSLLLSYALEPLVGGIVRLRVPRVVAATLVYLALVTGSAAGARAIHQQAISFAGDLPRVAGTIARMIRDTRSNGEPGPLDRLQAAAREIDGAVTIDSASTTKVRRVTPVQHWFTVRNYVLDISGSMAVIGVQGLVVAFLTFLLLATGDRVKWTVIEIAGPRLEDRQAALEVIRTIDRQIQRYLLARLGISAIVATATALGLLWVGVSHALIWGLLAGALNVLPFFGPIVAVALITLAAFVEFHTIGVTAAACAVSGAVAALEGNLITPWLTSRAGALNSVSVFVSVLFWGWMWDTWGLLLAIPIVVALKAAADHIEPLHAVGELLGE